jgi:hypothetical protein
MKFKIGDVLSYAEMCLPLGVSLQRGMNYRLGGRTTVILMSRRRGAPYDDQISDDGMMLTYEGHDCARKIGGPDPKKTDQPEFLPSGRPTQNGLFAASVRRYRLQEQNAETVYVFEKIMSGIWTYNGAFELIDYAQEQTDTRTVFKFGLKLMHQEADLSSVLPLLEQDEDRIIPSWVKQEVWKRDRGVCQEKGCGANTGLHFDHIIPYSKGGSSKDPRNIQLLCGRHNLQKRDKIA